MDIRRMGVSMVAAVGLVMGASGEIQKEGTTPPLLVASFSKAAAFILDTDGKVIWSYKMPGACQEAWLRSNGNILLSGGNTVREVTPAKKVVWEYTSPKGVPTEMHNCQPLPDGKALFGEGGTGRIIEVDATGKIIKDLKLELKGGPHGEMRQLRKLADGTYLLSNYQGGMVIIFDGDGKHLREITKADMEKQGVSWGALHSAEMLPNGNILIGGGYNSPFAEVNKQNEVVWKFSKDDLPELGFGYAAGAVCLPNGNIVIAGYNSKFSLFEITHDKKLVWKLDNSEAEHPTNVKVLAPKDIEPFRAASAAEAATPAK